MNRLPAVLFSLWVGCALPGGAVADDQRGSTAGITQIFLLFISDVSRGFLPKRAAAENKEKIAVKDPEQGTFSQGTQEERRRVAYKRVEDLERESRKAREEYRREAWNALGERRPAGDRLTDGRERLRIAERRMNEREWEAQQAKEAYQREARKAREERRRVAELASLGS